MIQTDFGPDLGPVDTNIMVSYYHVQYQKKLMTQSWENVVMDGQTDRRTDGQTDESDFIGLCPTNVELPI